MITNKIKTGKFATDAEYKSLIDAFRSGGSIQLLGNGITITRTAQSIAEDLLQDIAVAHGLPRMEKARYGISAEREIIAPGDADEWKGEQA